MSKITVTIEGPRGSGKTRLANLFQGALLNAGALFGRRVYTANEIARWNGMEIEFVEKTPEPVTSSLKIEVDSETVRTATTDLDALTKAAERAAASLDKLRTNHVVHVSATDEAVERVRRNLSNNRTEAPR